MGTITCDRKGCENIKDRVILDGTQYICQECWEELVNVKDNTWDKKMTAAEVRRSIERFMRTDVGEYREVDTKEEFDRLTGEPGEL